MKSLKGHGCCFLVLFCFFTASGALLKLSCARYHAPQEVLFGALEKVPGAHETVSGARLVCAPDTVKQNVTHVPLGAPGGK